VILASLRAAQLMRGCRPRIDGVHKNTVIAQLEVSQGKVGFQPPDDVDVVPDTLPSEAEEVPALVAG
jgi:DNA-directed RNA polymerase subunit K/omega